MASLQLLPCSVQPQYFLDHLIAMNVHFHRKSWSVGEGEHGCHQKDITPLGHQNLMDHKFLLYKDCKSARFHQRNIIFTERGEEREKLYQ